jgi:glycosyltransferase involved in cell wall biosynthesis
VFLDRAIYYFHRAHYNGPRELIIIDGSDERREVETTGRYIHNPSSVLQAGTAHNEACDIARGDIIIQWDDDDWQHPARILKQVSELLQFPGDAFAYTSRYYWYHIQQRQAVKAKSWEGGEGSTGATFAYWKETWKKTPFPDIPVGEDIPFQKGLRDRGCPMVDMQEGHLIVYMRHNQNGSALTNYDWSSEDTTNARELLRHYQDLDFYDGIGELLPVANWNHPNAPGSKMHVMNPLQQRWAKHFK